MVHHIPSNCQVEPVGGLNAGMSGQLLDLMEIESLNDPIAQTGPPQIVEGSIYRKDFLSREGLILSLTSSFIYIPPFRCWPKAWVGPSLLYQTERLVATGDLPLKPMLNGIGQIHSLSAEVNPRQAVLTFEVLDNVSVISGVADLRDTEKPNQFLFCHDAWTQDESTVRARYDGRGFNSFLHPVHDWSPWLFCRLSTKTHQDCRRIMAPYADFLSDQPRLGTRSAFACSLVLENFPDS